MSVDGRDIDSTPNPAFQAIGDTLREAFDRIQGRWCLSVEDGFPKLVRRDYVEDLNALDRASEEFFAGLTVIVAADPSLVDQWQATVDWIPKDAENEGPVTEARINEWAARLERHTWEDIVPISSDRRGGTVRSSVRPGVPQWMPNSLALIALSRFAQLFEHRRAEWKDRKGEATATIDDEKVQVWQFGPGWASYRGNEIRLTGKPLAVLKVLATSERQIATELTLFDQVWPREPVLGDTVRSAVSDARMALRDQLKGKVKLPTDPIPNVARGQNRLAWRLALV